MFVPELNTAFADFKAGKTDFDAYKAEIEATMDKIALQSDADKAKAFDVIMKSVRENMTGQDEPYEDGYGQSHDVQMWYDSDAKQYVWEATHQAIFGAEFFDFYNDAYTGG